VSRHAGRNPAADIEKMPVNTASASGHAATAAVPAAGPPGGIVASKQPGAGEPPAPVAIAAIAVPAVGKAASPAATGADTGERLPPAPAGAPEPSVPLQPAAAAMAGEPLPEPVRTALRQRGDALLAVGDVSAARRLYERAAAAGSGEAAAAAGKTYDPNILALIGAVGMRPDPEEAASWYRRAVALGDQDAARWLKGLGAQAR
jgi:TPR repeat protein